MNKLYPIFLKLDGKKCLVVGGGPVAARKIEKLLESGARVVAVSIDFSDQVRRLASSSAELELFERPFKNSDLAGAVLVIAATDSEEVNTRVHKETALLGLPVNVVDKPDLCSFYVPSIVTRGDLKIAISTDGKSPALAKKIRKNLEAIFDERYSRFLDVVGEFREELINDGSMDDKSRGALLNKIVNSDLLDRASGLTKEELLKEMKQWN